jgi:hypothetical protein
VSEVLLSAAFGRNQNPLYPGERGMMRFSRAGARKSLQENQNLDDILEQPDRPAKKSRASDTTFTSRMAWSNSSFSVLATTEHQAIFPQRNPHEPEARVTNACHDRPHEFPCNSFIPPASE